ncbi:hypothetical protein GA0115233_1002176 [Streptomyces sp. DI166]|nr:hypothetical protein GA0115233_1002176 [Streptomyces sp. DI166]
MSAEMFICFTFEKRTSIRSSESNLGALRMSSRE